MVSVDYGRIVPAITFQYCKAEMGVFLNVYEGLVRG